MRLCPVLTDGEVPYLSWSRIPRAFRLRAITASGAPPLPLKHQTHFIDDDGFARAISGGAVATPDEAANEAALAILGHQLGGDWPRAWRPVDAFERQFLTAVNVREEIEIDAAAVAAWVAARERSNGRRG